MGPDREGARDGARAEGEAGTARAGGGAAHPDRRRRASGRTRAAPGEGARLAGGGGSSPDPGHWRALRAGDTSARVARTD